MQILIIDNYDSFTYNLVHYLEASPDVQVEVRRNDGLQDLDWNGWDRVVISPGPGLPEESGDLMWAVAQLSKHPETPVLGVCLGLQAMVEFSGGSLYNLGHVRHGTPFPCIYYPGHSLFSGLPADGQVGLYHSWAADAETLPDVWEIIARSAEGIIMGLQHKRLPWIAVQFHPESILTSGGRKMIENWLKFA